MARIIVKQGLEKDLHNVIQQRTVGEPIFTTDTERFFLTNGERLVEIGSTDPDVMEHIKNLQDGKIDKEPGKGLSSNDYTTPEKEKLAGIEDNANNYVHPETHEASMIIFEDGQTIQDKFQGGQLVGPQGPQGEPGEQGPQGEPGDAIRIGQSHAAGIEKTLYINTFSDISGDIQGELRLDTEQKIHLKTSASNVITLGGSSVENDLTLVQNQVDQIRQNITNNFNGSKIYTELTQINPSFNVNTPLLQVVQAMANNTQLIANITSGGEQYPYGSGLLVITKSTTLRDEIRYIPAYLEDRNDVFVCRTAQVDGQTILTSWGSAGGVRVEYIPPSNVTAKSIEAGDQKVSIRWTDPEDIETPEQSGVWAGTKLIKKIGSYAVNANDGELVEDFTVRNQHQLQPYEVTGLINDTTYYFSLFPYSDQGLVNENPANRLDPATPVSPIVDVAPNDVSGKSIEIGDASVIIKWTDPTNISSETQSSIWAGTKLVYKVGSYPTSPTDGTLAVDSKVRDQYKSNGFKVSPLTNGIEYYFALFPYSDQGLVNKNPANRLQGTPLKNVAPGNVKAKNGVPGDSKVSITWTDPDDINDGTNKSVWKGTKLIKKIGSYPLNVNDGDLVVNSTTRNQYQSNPYEVSGLNNDTDYYFMLFPYSDKDLVNNNVANRIPVMRPVPDIVNVAPGDVTAKFVDIEDGAVVIKWSDPVDINSGNQSGIWAGTKLVYKVGSYPTSPTDGTLAVDNKKRDQYKSLGFRVGSLQNGIEYYFALFPYSDQGLVNTNTSQNGLTATPLKNVAPGNVKSRKITAGDSTISITWSDPDDINDGTNKSVWAGTKLVRKEGSYPLNVNDGKLIIDSKDRDRYKDVPYVDAGVTNGRTYTYTLFPYSDKGLVNESTANRLGPVTPESSIQNIAPGNVSGLQLEVDDGRVRIRWSDPPNISTPTESSIWAGTKLVYRINSYPTSPEDGNLAVDNRVRDNYKDNGFTVSSLTNGYTYYFALFPYSDQGLVNKNYSQNGVQGSPIRNIALPPITVKRAVATDTKITFTWTDPEDDVTGTTRAVWAGTKLVMKTGVYATDPSDGILIVDSKVRNQYRTNGLDVTSPNVSPGNTYYFTLFPYTDKGIVTKDANHKFQALSLVTPENVAPGDVKSISTTPAENQISITWTDPEDVTSGSTRSRWAGTKLVRKEGSYPTNESDGIQVVDSTRRNQYQSSPYVDAGLKPGTKYYYALFPYSDMGKYNRNENNRFVVTTKGTAINYREMTFKIDYNDSSSDYSITYSGASETYTPGSDNWDTFIGAYPVLLKNGVETKLNVYDFQKLKDGGGAADITSGEAGDVMIAFPRRGIKMNLGPDNILTVSVTDEPNNPEYTYIAHDYLDYTSSSQYRIKKLDKIYIGAYESCIEGNKVRSLSGKNVAVGHSITGYRAKLLPEHMLMGYTQLIYIQTMYLLKYKSRDCQRSLGRGTKGDILTGTANKNGMCYGNLHDNYTFVKLFGLENLWGSKRSFIDGVQIRRTQLVTSRGTFHDDETYEVAGTFTVTGEVSGYGGDQSGNILMGYLPVNPTKGSTTTYWSDLIFIDTTYNRIPAILGGRPSVNESWNMGLFSIYLNRESQGSDIGCRIMALGGEMK